MRIARSTKTPSKWLTESVDAMHVQHDINIFLGPDEDPDQITLMDLMDMPMFGKTGVHSASHIRMITHDGKVRYLKNRGGIHNEEEYLLKLI